MWGCVPFWVEANMFTVWDWGDALPSELIQFRLLIEYVGMRSLLSRSRFVCWLSMWECVSFWVEANTLLFEIEELRYLLSWYSFVFWLSMWECVSFWVEANTLLFEIEEVRYLLSWNRFVCWLSMWGCVPFWVEANTFTVWDWGDALPSKLIQFRLLIELLGMS